MPFPLIVLAAGLIGCVAAAPAAPRFRRRRPRPPATAACATPTRLLGGRCRHAAARRGAARRRRSSLALWLRAGRRSSLALGPDNVFADIALFFSKMAVVTFGGAYAVLAYVAQEAVGTYGWLDARRDARRPRHGRDDARAADHGLQFVGFLAAFRDPAGSTRWLAGVARRRC